MNIQECHARLKTMIDYLNKIGQNNDPTWKQYMRDELAKLHEDIDAQPE